MFQVIFLGFNDNITCIKMALKYLVFTMILVLFIDFLKIREIGINRCGGKILREGLYYLSILILLYSVRGLERSGLGGSHGCPGCLWDRFL